MVQFDMFPGFPNQIRPGEFLRRLLQIGGRAEEGFFQHQRGEDRLDRSGRADHVSGHGLCAVDRHIPRRVENKTDGFHFHGIPHRRCGPMRVDISDLFRAQSGHPDGFAHQFRAGFRVRDHHIGGIAVCGESGDHRLRPMSAGERMGFAFKDQDSGALPQHESVAILIERPAGLVGRIIIRVGKRAHCVETERLLPADLFRSADHHGIILTACDQPCSGDDCLSAAGARRADVIRLSGQPEHQRKIRHSGRGHDPGNGERRDLADPTGFHIGGRIAVHLGVGASAASVDDRHVMRQSLHCEPGLEQGFIRGDHRHPGVHRHETLVFLIQDRTLHIVIRHSGHLCVQTEFPPFRDKHGSGFSLLQRFRILLNPHSDRSYEAASGYNNSICHE